MDKKDLILSMFILYSGIETKLEQNPIDANKNHFKWFMWRNEFMFLQNYRNICKNFGGDAETEEGIRKGLENFQRTFIKKWVGFPSLEEEVNQLYEIYKSYEKL